MSISLSVPAQIELKPRITVFGVGGAGGNAVNNMIEAHLEGVEFVVANTDAQALSHNKAAHKIQLGTSVTQGLGAGSKPEVGRMAAEETMDQILDRLTGSHMVFITAGMGGGTGTGAAPVVARAAREQGMLTVGVVTKPFQFEGSHRLAIAEQGIEELQQYVDTLIIIPNQNLFRLANEKTTFAQAFAMADNVLHSGVRGVTDLMVMPGLINLDFADVRTVMSEMGKAMMGTGEASGEKRAIEAAEAAISNPLLDDVSMKGARGVLINITGGMDLTLFEVDEAANRIRSEVDPNANIIVGSTFNMEMEGRMRVSVVATGIDAEAQSGQLRLPQATGFPPNGGNRILQPQPQQRPQAAAAAAAAQAARPQPPGSERPVQPGLVASASFTVTAPQPPAAPPMLREVPAETPRPAAQQPSFEMTAQPAAESGRHPDGFIAVPPMPGNPPSRVTLGGATQVREAEPAPRKRSLGQSLLGIMTGNNWGGRDAPPAAAQQPVVPPRDHGRPAHGYGGQVNPPQAYMQAPSQFAQPLAAPQAAHVAPPRPAPAADYHTAQAPAAAQTLRLDPAERPSPPRSLDDQLEIPAFLRRQAN